MTARVCRARPGPPAAAPTRPRPTRCRARARCPRPATTASGFHSYYHHTLSTQLAHLAAGIRTREDRVPGHERIRARGMRGGNRLARDAAVDFEKGVRSAFGEQQPRA